MKALSKSFALITYILLLGFKTSFAQSVIAYKEKNKWGFKKGETIIIQPQYDTVFGFDQTSKICLAGNINPLKRSVNPLTKQVKIEYTYFYINNNNHKQFIRTSGTDSTTEVTVNKQSPGLYLNNNSAYVAMIGEKKYLVSKNGGTISGHGYSNLQFTKLPIFYITFTKDPKNNQEYLGLINFQNKEIIPPIYSKISFNTFDSVIYCCTAGIKFNGSDDVYNYGGGKIHSSAKHIHFATKKFVVYRLFESENSFVVFNVITGKEKSFTADFMYYLKEDIVALLDGDWYFYNLVTDKRYPMDKKILKHYNLND